MIELPEAFAKHARIPLLMGMLLTLTSCTDAKETPRVQLSVVMDASGLQEPVTTDLGWEVETTNVRVAVRDIQFTIAGEVHTSSLLKRTSDWLIPPAHAHPGHYQGGEVTGVLDGAHVAAWPGADAPLGDATLLVGKYEAANFTLDRGVAGAGGLAGEDPLVGETAIIEGIARKDGREISFSFLLGAPDGRQIVGVPFKADLSEQDAGKSIALRLAPYDQYEEDTLYDALDFALLDDDEDGVITISESSSSDSDQDAYNTLRRTFQTHDHFAFALVD